MLSTDGSFPSLSLGPPAGLCQPDSELFDSGDVCALAGAAISALSAITVAPTRAVVPIRRNRFMTTPPRSTRVELVRSAKTHFVVPRSRASPILVDQFPNRTRAHVSHRTLNLRFAVRSLVPPCSSVTVALYAPDLSPLASSR